MAFYRLFFCNWYLKKSQLENALKIATQDNAGIKDVCDWTRKISKSFTKSTIIFKK